MRTEKDREKGKKEKVRVSQEHQAERHIVGIEPTTARLKVWRSTTELNVHQKCHAEPRREGIKKKKKDCEARKKMQEEARKENQKKRQTALRKKGIWRILQHTSPRQEKRLKAKRSPQSTKQQQRKKKKKNNKQKQKKKKNC